MGIKQKNFKNLYHLGRFISGWLRDKQPHEVKYCPPWPLFLTSTKGLKTHKLHKVKASQCHRAAYRGLKAARSEAAADTGVASYQYLLALAFVGQRMLGSVRHRLVEENKKAQHPTLLHSRFKPLRWQIFIKVIYKQAGFPVKVTSTNRQKEC